MSSPSTPRMLSHGCRRTLVMILGTGGAPLPLRPAPRGRHRSWSLTASTRSSPPGPRSTSAAGSSSTRSVTITGAVNPVRRTTGATPALRTTHHPCVRADAHRIDAGDPNEIRRPPSMQRRQNEPLHTWEVFVSHAQVALILGAGDITARRGPPADGSCDRAVRLGGRRHPSPPRRSGLSRTSGFTVRQIRT